MTPFLFVGEGGREGEEAHKYIPLHVHDLEKRYTEMFMVMDLNTTPFIVGG